jgi:hypothetical protein
MNNAPDLPLAFTAMTRLDHNRAKRSSPPRLGAPSPTSRKMTIWGNHSATQYPDLFHCEVNGQNAPTRSATRSGSRNTTSPPSPSAARRSSRPAARRRPRRPPTPPSTTSATGSHGTPEGDWVSMAVVSDGSYGVPEGLISSFPCTTARTATGRSCRASRSTTSAAAIRAPHRRDRRRAGRGARRRRELGLIWVSIDVAPARSSRCSARAGAARPRCCVRSPASSASTPGRSPSTVSWSRRRRSTPPRAAPHRDGLPGLGPLPAPHRRRRTSATACRARSAAGSHRRVARSGRPRRARRPPAVHAVGRPAAAGRTRSGTGSATPALLLDEPFSNLDTALRVQVRTEVHRLLTELGVTTVFVTHDQEEAFVLGDRVAVMHEGASSSSNTRRRSTTTRPPGGSRLRRRGQPRPGRGRRRSRRRRDRDGDLQSAHVGPVDVLVRPEQLCSPLSPTGLPRRTQRRGDRAARVLRTRSRQRGRTRRRHEPAQPRPRRSVVRRGQRVA